MASVTTNYGFDVPTSSDLVKNGATQIALLGQDLDTFLFRPFTRNMVINGGMDVWQRGTTGLGTSTGTYTADRWVLGSSSTTVTRDTDVPVSPYFQYSLKMVGTGDNSLIQRVEASNSTLLAGQTVTFSFYAKRTAGAGALDVRFYYPTTADTYGAITQIGSTVVVAASPSSSWTRYTVTAAIGTNITTGLQILINNTGAATTFITGAQLEIGSQASPFTRAGGNIQGELAMCQRYYYRNTSGAAYVNMGIGAATSTTASVMDMQFPVTMRIAPTSVDFSTLRLQDFAAGYAVTSLTIGTNGTGFQMGEMTANVASGLTSGKVYWIGANNSSTAYIAFSAELQEMTMDKVTFVFDQDGVEHAIIDRGNDEFTSMTKAHYEAQLAANEAEAK